MKIFISQPMRGKTGTQILAERKEAQDHLREMYGEGVEFIESYMDDDPVGKNEALYKLGRSLELMAGADLVYFMKGWEDARGCKIENECAIAYGITVQEDYREG